MATFTQALQVISTSSNRVPAPLTGSVTTGTWLSKDLSPPSVVLASKKAMHFNYILPAQYSNQYSYPVLLYLHPNFQANPWYLNQWTDPLTLAKIDADGYYNTVNFRTNYPCIVVVPYADQSTDANGGADQNWGGWNNNGLTGSPSVYSGDSGPNVYALYETGGVMDWISSNFSTDPTRYYVTGISLGGHGTEYAMLKYNRINGTRKLFTAGYAVVGTLEINGYHLGPSTADINAFKQGIPLWCVNGDQDTASYPTSYNEPLWTALTGNSTYPSAYSSEATSRASSYQYHFWLQSGMGHQQDDLSGNPWELATAPLNWMFGQII